jgi:hypothetical protein
MEPAPYSCVFSATLGHFLAPARARRAGHGVGGRPAAIDAQGDHRRRAAEKRRTTGGAERAGRRGHPRIVIGWKNRVA